MLELGGIAIGTQPNSGWNSELGDGGKVFQPVLIPKFTNPNIENFRYVYKEKEVIYGHVVWHVGDGIYMFQEPIELKENREAICAELKSQYPDLVFYKFGDRYEYQRKKGECILFVISRMNRIICNHAELDWVTMKLDAAGNYAGPAAVEYLWNKFGSYRRIRCHQCVGCDDRELGLPEKEEMEAIETGSGLLQFEFNPDSVEECDGYKKYILLGGSVGIMIDKGIYCFSPPDKEGMVSGSDYSFKPGDYLPAEEYLRYALHGKQTTMDFEGFVGMLLDRCHSLGGSISPIYYGIRYLAFGGEAVKKLCKLGEHLGRYRIRIDEWKKNSPECEQNSIGPIDLSSLFALLQKLEENPKPEISRQPTEEDAVELAEGVGMTGLTVVLKLAFQQEGLKCYCEYAYVLKDCIILGIEERGRESVVEKYIIPICMISELNIIVKMNLFGVITEKFSVPVIKNERIEERFMSEEMYQHYTKMLKTLNSIGEKWIED